MDYELLDTFVLAATTLNMTKTANLLFVTQPTISKRIKILENELGYKLFIRMRGKRQLELTVKGEQFLDLAQEWLKIYADMESLKKRNKTKLSIVSIDSLATSILPKLMISLKYMSRVTKKCWFWAIENVGIRYSVFCIICFLSLCLRYSFSFYKKAL